MALACLSAVGLFENWLWSLIILQQNDFPPVKIGMKVFQLAQKSHYYHFTERISFPNPLKDNSDCNGPLISSSFCQTGGPSPVLHASFWKINCHHIKLMSWHSSGPEFRVVWLSKMPASGWRSLWKSSSLVPWFVLNAFRDVSGAVPE